MFSHLMQPLHQIDAILNAPHQIQVLCSALAVCDLMPALDLTANPQFREPATAARVLEQRDECEDGDEECNLDRDFPAVMAELGF